MKLLLRTPVSPYTGYGNDGLGLVRAFLRRGIDLYLQPLSVDPPLPEYVAKLLTKRLDAPFDLILTHTHTDHVGFAANMQQKRAARMHVGWTMWEYTNFDNLEAGGLDPLADRSRKFDLLLGYDPVSCGALDALATNVPVRQLQGGYLPEDWPEVERDWHSDRFGFFMNGQLHGRKDPFVAIEAFRELKDEHPDFEGAELHLKTNVPGLFPQMEEWIPKLRVHYDVWPTDVLRAFYAKQHCLLSPSRGEGKNMPALEFMSTGGLTIATGWGGHTVWQHPDYSYALDYELKPLGADFPNTLNARASKEHLKELMLRAYRNRSESRRMGELAAKAIPQVASWDYVVDRLLLLLADFSEEGRTIYELAQIALSQSEPFTSSGGAR